MTYMSGLQASEFVNNESALLNLILDQTERFKDLFFKVEIFSSMEFLSSKLGKKLAFKYDLPVPTIPVSGGTPSDPFFYKNPQFLVQIDQTKFLDKSKILNTQVETMLSYTSNQDASVKLFLCKTKVNDNSKGHNGRVFQVNEDNIATKEIYKAAYKPGECISSQIL